MAIAANKPKKKLITEVGPKEVAVYDKKIRKFSPGLGRTRLLPVCKAPSRKILVMSCLHIPLWDEELVEKTLHDERDADGVVLNGDIMDCYSVSVWPKDRDISLVHEYNIAYDFVHARVARDFPWVLFVEGNHEVRLKSFLSQKLDPNVQWLAQADLLQKIVDGERHFSDGKRIVTKEKPRTNIFYNPGQESFWDIVGFTIFMHPLSYASAPMGTVVAAAEYMEHKRQHFDCVTMAHTHYQGKIIRDGRVLIETGCLANPMDYSKKGKLFYRPQQSGYAVVYQDKDGNVDPNRTNFIHLGTTVEHKDDGLKRLRKVSEPEEDRRAARSRARKGR